MDRTDAAIRAGVPGGWLVLSLLILTPAVLEGGFSAKPAMLVIAHP